MYAALFASQLLAPDMSDVEPSMFSDAHQVAAPGSVLATDLQAGGVAAPVFVPTAPTPVADAGPVEQVHAAAWTWAQLGMFFGIAGCGLLALRALGHGKHNG